MGLSMGAATDYLVATAQTVTAGMTVNGNSIAVSDGWELDPQDGTFAIGLDQPPTDAQTPVQGTRTWKGFLAHVTEEDYTIPCYIDCRVGGNSTQKGARDAAIAIFDAFYAVLVANNTLGGALNLFAEITDVSLVPQAVSNAAERGSRALLTFGVHCKNRYTT